MLSARLNYIYIIIYMSNYYDYDYDYFFLRLFLTAPGSRPTPLVVVAI